MTGYETFGIYEALKLHFTKDSYDFFKYNGKTNISVTAFENRKDKYHFYKLSRKLPNREDLIDFIVANLIKNETLWVGDLLNDDAVVTYRQRQRVLQSLSYIFENDCKKVFDGVEDPNDVIKVNDGSYPVLLTQMLQKNIEFETVCVLSKILGFLSMWQKKITDDIRWPTVHRKLTKYAAFLPQDVVKYKLILKRVIND
jgi:hypothetical protein